MNAELPLFSLKFKNYAFKDNKTVYLFLGLSLLLIALLQFVAIPIIIGLYILMSLIVNLGAKKQA